MDDAFGPSVWASEDTTEEVESTIKSSQIDRERPDDVLNAYVPTALSNDVWAVTTTPTEENIINDKVVGESSLLANEPWGVSAWTVNDVWQNDGDTNLNESTDSDGWTTSKPSFTTESELSTISTANVNVREPVFSEEKEEEETISLPPLASLSSLYEKPTLDVQLHSPDEDEWISVHSLPPLLSVRATEIEKEIQSHQEDEFDEFEDPTDPVVADSSDVWGSHRSKKKSSSFSSFESRAQIDVDAINALAHEQAFKLRQLLEDILKSPCEEKENEVQKEGEEENKKEDAIEDKDIEKKESNRDDSFRPYESIYQIVLNTEGHFERLFSDSNYAEKLISSIWWNKSSTRDKFIKALGTTAPKINTLNRLSSSFHSMTGLTGGPSPMSMSTSLASPEIISTRGSIESGRTSSLFDAFATSRSSSIDSLKSISISALSTITMPRSLDSNRFDLTQPKKSFSQSDSSLSDYFENGKAVRKGHENTPHPASSDPFGDLSMFESSYVMKPNVHNNVSNLSSSVDSMSIVVQSSSQPSMGIVCKDPKTSLQNSSTNTIHISEDDFFDVLLRTPSSSLSMPSNDFSSDFFNSPVTKMTGSNSISLSRGNSSSSKLPSRQLSSSISYSIKPTIPSLPPVSLTKKPIDTNFKVAPALPPPPGMGQVRHGSLDLRGKTTSSTGIDLFGSDTKTLDEFDEFESPNTSKLDDLSFLDGLL